jgi:hypothetical protein
MTRRQGELEKRRRELTEGDKKSDGERTALASVQVVLTPNSLLSVVVGNSSGLCVVGTQSLLECLCVVIRSLNKGFTCDIILHGLLGRAARQ